MLSRSPDRRFAAVPDPGHPGRAGNLALCRTGALTDLPWSYGVKPL